MNFAIPAAWGWFAVAAPVILLYLIRQKLRIQPVSNILFWQQLKPTLHNTPLWRHLRRWISLLLQILFVALLTAALARPLFSGQSKSVVSLVLVMDPAVTMQARDGKLSRWQEAVDRAVERVDQLRFFDEATLILASDPPRILSGWNGRGKELKRILRSLKPQETPTDVRPALALARNLAQTRGHGAIEFITDGVWIAPPDNDQFKDVRVQMIGKERDNTGLTLFAVRRSINAPGEYHLSLRLEQNTGTMQSGEVEILRNGALMDALKVNVGPGHPWQKFWQQQGNEAATFEAKWKPSAEDVLSPDDAGRASVESLTDMGITLVSPSNAFLETALKSQPLSRVVRIPPTDSIPGPETSNLWIFHQARPPSMFPAPAMVLINPGDSGFWGEKTGALENPIASGTHDANGLFPFVNFGSVQMRSATEFKPAAGAHVYLESFGKPLVFGQWEHEPRWLVVAFDLENSDFVFRTAFPIFLGNVIQSLRPPHADNNASLPGPVATHLKRTAPQFGDQTSPAVKGSWTAFPLWWWAVLCGGIWLMVEWYFYSRRITE